MSAGSLTRKPKQKRTSVATPLIPKHFSPGCFVINIPKGAEDLIKSILLKGRFSKACLQVPASRQRLCSHTLLCHPKPGAGRGLDFLCWCVSQSSCPSAGRASALKKRCWEFFALFLMTSKQLCLSGHAPLESCGHGCPPELSHAHNASLCSPSASSTIP